MAFAKFEENRFRIDGEIAENHAILVNLTASIVAYRNVMLRFRWGFIGLRSVPRVILYKSISTGIRKSLLHVWEYSLGLLRDTCRL